MAAKPFPLSVSRGAATDAPTRVLTLQQKTLRTGATATGGPQRNCRSRVPFQLAGNRERSKNYAQEHARAHADCVPAYCPDEWRQRSTTLFAVLHSIPVVEASKMAHAAGRRPRGLQSRRHHRAVFQWLHTMATVLSDFPLNGRADFHRSIACLQTDSIRVLATSQRLKLSEPSAQLTLAIMSPPPDVSRTSIGMPRPLPVASGPAPTCPAGWYL